MGKVCFIQTKMIEFMAYLNPMLKLSVRTHNNEP